MFNKLKSFYMKKSNLVILSFISIILIILYFVLLYIQDIQDIRIINALIRKQPIESSNLSYIIDCILILITVIVSMLISSIFSVLLVGKRDSTKIYNDAVSDMLENSDIKMEVQKTNNTYLTTFYKELDSKNFPQNMLDTAITQITTTSSPYYYDSCNITINCFIKNNQINKHIKKEISILSYQDTYEYTGTDNNMFMLVAQRGTPNITRPLKVMELKVEKDGTKFSNSPSDCSIKYESIKRSSRSKEEYTKKATSYYNKPLVLSNKKPTKITIVYETITPLSDLDYVFRTPCSCHNFSISFHLKNMPNYKLTGYAFGFLDDASSTVDMGDKDDLEFKFSNWIFKYDGVCISIKENNFN